MRKLYFSFLLLLCSYISFAQLPSTVKGRVIDYKRHDALENITAVLQSTSQTAITNSEGVFAIDIPSGNQTLIIASAGYISQTFNLKAIDGRPLDLGTILLEEDITTEQQLNIITIPDNELNDDNGGSETTSGLLQASKDIYQQAAAFNWSQTRFKIRGLDNQYGTTMINGVSMNKLYDGRPQWSNWGGLNDATRNQEFTMGSSASDYTFGGLLGTQEINTRASVYRKGSRVSFSGTNTNYDWRAMATYASGMNKKGFSYVVSASRRWAQEGYFDGTDYGANSLFVSMEKKFNNSHSLNFTGIYAQNSRGKTSPNTAEVTSFMGEKYNAYWGWQDGKKRNSRDIDIEEPILMLNHYWRINVKNTVNTSVAYQFGKIANSRIDYQYVNNPDPAFYRNLPSYYTSLYNNNPAEVPDSAYQPGGLGGVYIGNSPQNLLLAQEAQASFLANPQLDWNNMYLANTRAVTDENNTEAGRVPDRSKYVLYEDRSDNKTWTVNSILHSQLADNTILDAGISYKRTKSNNYQNLLDLLGGSYYLDIDPFFTGTQSQSDLNNPNRTVTEGDTFGYNYNLIASQLDAFTQFRFSYRRTDFYLAQNFSKTGYQREGLYKNGIYPTSSYGKSDRVSFDNFGFKGGLLYKLTGRYLFSANAVYMTKAPQLKNTFPNARLNNSIVENIDSEKIYGIDGSFIIRAPLLKARLTGFYNKILNSTENSFFFAEGVFEGQEFESNAFLAETVTGLDRKMIGLELGIEYQLTATLKTTFCASYGQYIYDSNPTVYINNDAFTALDQEVNVSNSQTTTTNFGASQLKDYKLPGMPQQAYSAGLEYRDPKYWWIGANINYLTGSYLDVSALLRTDNFYKNPQDINGFPFPEATDQRGRELLKQEQFDDMFITNLVGGKSWKIKKQYLGFFAGINNVFDLTYKTGGFEQARNANYRQLNQDVSSGTPSFGPKYFYGYGRTYYINVYFNF